MNKEIKPCWNPDCTESLVSIYRSNCNIFKYVVACMKCGNHSKFSRTAKEAIDNHNEMQKLDKYIRRADLYIVKYL